MFASRDIRMVWSFLRNWNPFRFAFPYVCSASRNKGDREGARSMALEKITIADEETEAREKSSKFHTRRHLLDASRESISTYSVLAASRVSSGGSWPRLQASRTIPTRDIPSSGGDTSSHECVACESRGSARARAVRRPGRSYAARNHFLIPGYVHLDGTPIASAALARVNFANEFLAPREEQVKIPKNLRVSRMCRVLAREVSDWRIPNQSAECTFTRCASLAG
jgi:hypothetical protein